MRPLRSFCFLLTSLGLLAATGWAESEQPQRMTRESRMAIIRSISSETVFVHRAFPSGQRGLVLKDGQLEPDEETLAKWIAQEGPAARPGDRVRITNVLFKGRSIIFEINGGPRKRKKWYERLEISGMGGTASPGDVNPTVENARGSYIALAFDGHVPDMTPDDVRELLTPVFNFHSVSAAEAYLETIPENVREAIKNHEVLVGMNREMVTHAKGRPSQRIREREPETGVEFEEWIYGRPPQDVEFVRFVGDEVVRLTIMPVTGERIVKTEREVDATQYATGLPQARPGQAAEAGEEPPKRPTLRRPGEVAGADDPRAAQPVPDRTTVEPEWGRPAPTQPGTTPPDSDEPEL